MIYLNDDATTTCNFVSLRLTGGQESCMVGYSTSFSFVPSSRLYCAISCRLRTETIHCLSSQHLLFFHVQSPRASEIVFQLYLSCNVLLQYVLCLAVALVWLPYPHFCNTYPFSFTKVPFFPNVALVVVVTWVNCFLFCLAISSLPRFSFFLLSTLYGCLGFFLENMSLDWTSHSASLPFSLCSPLFRLLSPSALLTVSFSLQWCKRGLWREHCVRGRCTFRALDCPDSSGRSAPPMGPVVWISPLTSSSSSLRSGTLRNGKSIGSHMWLFWCCRCSWQLEGQSSRSYCRWDAPHPLSFYSASMVGPSEKAGNEYKHVLSAWLRSPRNISFLISLMKPCFSVKIDYLERVSKRVWEYQICFDTYSKYSNVILVEMHIKTHFE